MLLGLYILIILFIPYILVTALKGIPQGRRHDVSENRKSLSGRTA